MHTARSEATFKCMYYMLIELESSTRITGIDNFPALLTIN